MQEMLSAAAQRASGLKGLRGPLGSLFWEAREVFTWEEKVEKKNSIVSKRGQVGKGAKKIRHLEHLLIYSLLFFKETP